MADVFRHLVIGFYCPAASLSKVVLVTGREGTVQSSAWEAPPLGTKPYPFASHGKFEPLKNRGTPFHQPTKEHCILSLNPWNEVNTTGEH